jgi:Cu(I)/Ag(I) efflux system protein CusF
MKQSILLPLVLALALAVPAMSHAQSTTQGAVHKGVGVVKKVDPVRNTITLDHEPIKSLSWPGMRMSFTVKDKALLAQAQPGKKVEFEFVQQGKDYQITSVK